MSDDSSTRSSTYWEGGNRVAASASVADVSFDGWQQLAAVVAAWPGGRPVVLRLGESDAKRGRDLVVEIH